MSVDERGETGRQLVPRQMIQVGDQQVALPAGVTLPQWALERVRWQNPRIRSLLGAIRLLEGVQDSNYALLHCSPARLQEIWGRVRRASELVRGELGPLLREPSVIPELEQALVQARSALELLEVSVLDDLERFPAEVDASHLIEVRKLLCISIGKIHAFLQDTFGSVLSNDPRSRHDSDYFLSKRFPRDIEEAEWLHSTVSELKVFLSGVEKARVRRLGTAIARLRQERTLPAGRAWEELEGLLERLSRKLTPRLQEILALRGIRFHEMELLDDYAFEIPAHCRTITEIYQAGREAIDVLRAASGDSREERERSLSALVRCHAAFSERLVRQLSALDRALQDLWVFVPIWLRSIERRRALLLR